MSLLLASSSCCLLRGRRVGLLDGQPDRARPHALGAHGQRGGDLAAVADAPGGEHRDRRDRVDHLRPQDDAADLAGVATRLAALGDDDVDAGVARACAPGRRAAQSAATSRPALVDLCSTSSGGVSRARWRSAAPCRAQRGPRPAASRSPRSSPAAARCAVSPSGSSGTPWSASTCLANSMWPSGTISRSCWVSFVGVHLAHSLVLAGDDDVDAVGMVADVLVDPVELDGQLLGAEAHRAEHAEPARPADSGDDVAAMGESEDRELDSELITDRCVHGGVLRDGRVATQTVGGRRRCIAKAATGPAGPARWCRPTRSATCWPADRGRRRCRASPAQGQSATNPR